MAHTHPPGPTRAELVRPPARSRLRRLLAGGTAGNTQLTAAAGVLLIVLLAALGVTIVRIGALLSAHMFLGMLLLGPLALKLGSTGYRFARYYGGARAYREKGPPPLALRLLAPAVVASSLAVFGTGVALLLVGPDNRGVLSLLHKVTFIVWLGATAIHVLGHLSEIPAAWRQPGRAPRQWDDQGSGRGARGLLLVGALVGGLVVALLAESQFGAWTHFHHGG